MTRIDPALISLPSVIGARAAEEVATPADDAPLVRADVPLGAYGRSSGAANMNSSSAASWLSAQQGGDPIGTRLRAHLQNLLADENPQTPREDLLAIQAIALQAVSVLFTDQFHDDGALLAEVERKQRYYRDRHPGGSVAQAVLRNRDVRAVQLDSLNVILRTFQGTDAADVALRLAVYDKLGKLGRKEDITAVMPHIRKATTPADMFHAQECVRAITRRTGAPVERKDLSEDPEIGPLLKKSRLTPTERTLVIEEVLKRGAIDFIEPFYSGQYHGAEVCVVHFKEKLPGEKEAIKAAFKPELTWPDKPECWYAREVLAYSFDRAFTKTGLIPVTVEGTIPLREAGCEVGSLSFWEPRCEPLGRRPVERAWDGTVPADQIPPRFRHLANEPWFQARIAQLRTLAFIFNNGDMIANNLVPRNNFANILVVEDLQGNWDLRVIDWSPSVGGDRNAGGGFGTIERNFLPPPLPEIQHKIEHTGRSAVAEVGKDFVKAKDAQMLADRMRAVEDYWRRK